VNIEVERFVGIGAVDVEDRVVGDEFTEASVGFRFVPIGALRML